jgi:hypothetical protein
LRRIRYAVDLNRRGQPCQSIRAVAKMLGVNRNRVHRLRQRAIAEGCSMSQPAETGRMARPVRDVRSGRFVIRSMKIETPATKRSCRV